MISAAPTLVHRTEINISVPNQKAEAAALISRKHIRTLVQSNQSNASVIGWDGKDHKAELCPGTVCKISRNSQIDIAA